MSSVPNAAQQLAPLTKEDVEVLMSGPAIYSNRIMVNVNQGGVRITFCELTEGVPPKYRTAVVMTLQDAIALKNLLTSLLAKSEQQLAAITSTNG